MARLIAQGWRHLRFGGSKWHTLHQDSEGHRAIEAGVLPRKGSPLSGIGKELAPDITADEKAARPLLAQQEAALSNEAEAIDDRAAQENYLGESAQSLELQARQVTEQA